MAEVKKIEALNVRRAVLTNPRLTNVTFIAKDGDGNIYEMDFVIKSHYGDSLNTMIKRLSPVQLPKVAPVANPSPTPENKLAETNTEENKE